MAHRSASRHPWSLNRSQYTRLDRPVIVLLRSAVALLLLLLAARIDDLDAAVAIGRGQIHPIRTALHRERAVIELDEEAIVAASNSGLVEGKADGIGKLVGRARDLGLPSGTKASGNPADQQGADGKDNQHLDQRHAAAAATPIYEEPMGTKVGHARSFEKRLTWRPSSSPPGLCSTPS